MRSSRSFISDRRAAATACALSGTDGRFSATGLEPGPYSVHATHPNFPGPFGLPQTGLQLDVTSGRQTAEAVIKLQPGGVISGKILDDGGEPVADCTLNLFTVRIGDSLSRESASAASDDQGNFRLEPLPPDRYVLSVRCSQDLPSEHILDVNPTRGFETAETWQRIFYQDSTTFGGATEIGVAPGSEVQLELHLKPQAVKTIRGVVTGSVGARPGGLLRSSWPTQGMAPIPPSTSPTS
ncbi:MAG: carboxypeptidase-like regulatory domain-containing protein [Paludibaculum sp.]